ncbi:MAG TPA: hypothetical protein VEC12_11970 [Bacteroidia bacterium]|nr:hypothetical protein [Bacteroidia bacterium]
MKTKILLAIVLLGSLLTSCSKTDESAEPVNTGNNTWVNYTHTVSAANAWVYYDVEYLTQSGMQKAKNRRGNFSARVPVHTFDSAGTRYARTIITIRTVAFKTSAAPVINSALKVASDYGFIVAETSKSAEECGYTERTVVETRPLSWFTVK